MNIQLTHTGLSAGKTLCGAPRGEQNFHASLTPLEKPEVRAKCCQACVATWLAYAYAGDPLPDWPTTIEEVAKLENEIPQEFASDAEVAEFRVKLRERTEHLRKHKTKP